MSPRHPEATPETASSRVVLPAPLGPTTARILPAATVNETPRRISSEPTLTRTSLSSSVGFIEAPAQGRWLGAVRNGDQADLPGPKNSARLHLTRARPDRSAAGAREDRDPQPQQRLHHLQGGEED